MLHVGGVARIAVWPSVRLVHRSEQRIVQNLLCFYVIGHISLVVDAAFEKASAGKMARSACNQRQIQIVTDYR